MSTPRPHSPARGFRRFAIANIAKMLYHYNPHPAKKSSATTSDFHGFYRFCKTYYYFNQGNRIKIEKRGNDMVLQSSTTPHHSSPQ